MDKILKIYELVNNVETPFPDSTLQAELYSFQHDSKRMGNAPTITGTIMYPICLDNLWNDNVFVDFRGEKYFIDLTPSSSYSNTDTRYKHELVFVSERRILETKIFTDGVLTEFRFFGDLNMLVQRLNDFFDKEGLSYSVVVDTGITTEEKDVDIKNMYVNDVLLYGFELFNIPYYFKGKEIHFGHYENEITEVFEYGVDNALLAVNKENTNDKVIARITGVGSRDNIPYYYPNFNESGEHDVTTTPSGYEPEISKLNYLKIDPYTNLRNGGWAKYHHACVNPISDDIDNIFVAIDNNNEENVYKTDFTEKAFWNVEQDPQNEYFSYLSLNITKNTRVRVIPKRNNTIYINKKIEFSSDDSNVNGVLDSESISVVARYQNGSVLPIPYTISGDFIRIDIPSYIVLSYGIIVNISSETKSISKTIQDSNSTYYPINLYFSYDTKYHTNKRNLTVKSEYDSIDENVYLDFNKVIDYPNGQYDYRNIFTYKVTREVAGYSTVYSDTIFRGMFLDADGKGMTEWYKFTPSSVVIKDSDGNDVTERWWDSVNEYIHFRNTTSVRKTYTIEMTVLVQMSTPGTAAYGVQLYYNPDFGRYEFPYDYWKFHDSGTRQKYSVFGVKFIDTSQIPDSLYVNFSATTNWIDPKPYLMPKVYRDTLGQNIWYNAENGQHTDENGQNITFVNEYNPNKSKEHISDPKDDIKPTIVGVINAYEERIDQFADVAFDTNDNNDEWITDENGNNQELKHSFFFVKLRKMDFNLFDQALETGEMTISMTSGHCGRCNFTIMVDEETQQNTVQVDTNGDLVRDGVGNVITYGTPLPQQQDTTQNEVWIALRKEEDSYGVIMPDNDKGLVPIAGQDTFVLTNILPDSYIKNAEQKLEYELLKDLKENNEEKFNFSIDFSRIYFAENQNILSRLNENSKLYVKYNDDTNELYVNSYTYKMDNNTPLPEIKVVLKKSIAVVKNAIQKSEGKLIRYVKEVTYNNQQSNTNDSKGGGITTQNNDISVVQTTGGSTTKVMSQKAVTDALKAIDGNNVEVTQYMGQSTEKVMSQKSVTDELQKLASNMTEVVQTTGNSTVKVMSQKSTTDAINDVDKVLPFDGFIDEAEILNQTNPYDGGKIYFVKSVNRFAYYREQDGIYTALWNGYDKYATIIAGQGVIPNSDRIFVYNTQLYLWDGETLISVGGDKTEIPSFKGIITRATVINQTGFYKYGEVYFIESPSIDGVAIDNGIFAYKIRDSYYRSWHSVGEYMNTELSEPITDKLFVFNKQHYVYSDNKLELLSNIGKLNWERF